MMYSLNHTESTLVAVAPQHLTTILKLKSRLPTIKAVLCLETLSEETRKIYQAWGEEVGVKIFDIPQGR